MRQINAVRVQSDGHFHERIAASAARRVNSPVIHPTRSVVERATHEPFEQRVTLLGAESRRLARRHAASIHLREHAPTLRENVRAQLRVLVKRILRKYGYPPDKQEKAIDTVLKQAELLADSIVTM